MHMCMLLSDHMLTQRLHVLVDTNLLGLLEGKAKKEGASVGEVVRRAVKDYCVDTDTQERTKRKKLVANLLAHRKKYLGRFEGVDYRKLVEDGRRR